MGEYKKGKYSFSLAPALSVIGQDYWEVRCSEAKRLIGELESYGIIIKDLVAVEVPYEIRNEILNIAMFISEDVEIYNYLYEKKKLPVTKLSRIVKKNKKFFERWNEYIIAYSIIIGDYNYRSIAEYLKIIENMHKKEVKEEDKVIEFKSDYNNNSDNYNRDIAQDSTAHKKGILILKFKKYGIVITSSGEFIKSVISSDDNVGEEIIIEVKKKNKNLIFYISLLLILILCAFSIGIYKYFNVASTIVFDGGEYIVLEVNSFNRVVNARAAKEEGNDILRQIQIQDRNIDVAMYRLVKYINEEEILNSKQILITVTGNAIKHGVLEQTTGYLSEEGISVKFNNAGYESSLY